MELQYTPTTSLAILAARLLRLAHSNRAAELGALDPTTVASASPIGGGLSAKPSTPDNMVVNGFTSTAAGRGSDFYQAEFQQWLIAR